MSSTADDQTLVAAASAGDHDAFAALYDRYAHRIHTFAFSRLRDPADAADALQITFVTAYRKLDQLDDGARFRPWVFAIARTTIIDIARSRGRQPTATADEELLDVAAEQRAVERDLEAEESGALLWHAAAGLQPRDQELLELHLREGLEGAALAEAMDVEPAHVYVMVKRLKERLGTAVGSLLVARRGADDCDDLRRLLGAWDGGFSLSVRSAVTRHVESCETCQETRRAAVAWESIASAMPSVPAPAVTRGLVLADVGAILPASRTFGGVGRKVMAAVTIAATITMTIGVVALPVLWDEPTPTAAPVATVTEAPTTTDPASDDAEVAGEIETATTTTQAVARITTTTTTEAPIVTATTAPPAPTPTAPPATRPTTTTTTTTTITVVIGPAPTTIAPPSTAPSTTAPTTTARPTTTTTTTPVVGPPVTTPTTTTTTTTTTEPPLPGELGIDVTGIDFGTADTTATFTITNGGDGPLTWSATLPAGETRFAVSPTSGTLEVGADATVTVTFDRTSTPEGDPTSVIALTSDGGDESVPLSAAVDNPPDVAISAPTELWENAGACEGGVDPARPVQGVAVMTVSDESPPITVDAGLDGTLSRLQPTPGDPTSFSLQLGPNLSVGTATLDVIAVDARGNPATRSVAITVNACGN